MSIKIRTERVVIQGEKRYVILEVKALEKTQMPLEYFNLEKDQEIAIWYDKYSSSLTIKRNGQLTEYITEGKKYHLERFDEKINLCKQAGDRLKKINDQLAIDNAGWEGEVEFVI